MYIYIPPHRYNGVRESLKHNLRHDEIMYTIKTLTSRIGTNISNMDDYESDENISMQNNDIEELVRIEIRKDSGK